MRGAISFNSSTHFRPNVPAGSLDRQLFAQHAICAVQAPLGEEPGEGGAFTLEQFVDVARRDAMARGDDSHREGAVFQAADDI